MSFGVLLCFLAVSPVITSGSHKSGERKYTTASSGSSTISTTAVVAKSSKQLLEEEADGLYQTMNLRRLGLSRKAFEYAWRGYKSLLQSNRITKEQVLSICDFSQSSRRKRFYIIDVEEKKVLINTWVAHGRNSGGEYARSFSNKPESHKSSLGFYVTANTYYGSHGLSLKIEGLEKNINDRADARNIVIHGSEYVGADFLSHSPINGRSFGCPALPAQETEEIIETIKDGTCLFIYHPTKSYIQKSKVLNG